MRKALVAALSCVVAPLLNVSGATTAPAAPIGASSISHVAKVEGSAVTRVGGYRCRRCDWGYGAPAYYAVPAPPPAVVVVTPRFTPGVVYYGPSGIVRPYPPVVVYDAPVYPAGWYYSRRYSYGWRDGYGWGDRWWW